MIGALRVGDRVTNPVTGGAQRVLGVYPRGIRHTWRFTCDDGASVVVDDDHLWATRLANHRRPLTKTAAQRIYASNVLADAVPQSRFDTLTLLRASDMASAHARGASYRIPLTSPVLFDVNGRTGDTSVSPYAIGCMLGDGTLHAMSVCAFEDGMRANLIAEGFTPGPVDPRHGAPVTFLARGAFGRAFRQWAGNHGLRNHHAWDKFIPPYVFTAALPYRVGVLQGLMDTDGYVDARSRCYFGTTSAALAIGVQALVRSLGGKARIADRQTAYTYRGAHLDGRPSFRVRLWLPRTSALFRLTRKRARCTDSWNGGAELSREVVAIDDAGFAETVCIRVSGIRGLYVTRDYLVTHNTDSLIGDWAAHWRRNGAKCNGILIRRTTPQLEEIVKRTHEIYPRLGATWLAGLRSWRMSDGAILKLRWLDRDEDAAEYQGHSYDWIGIDELGSFPDPAPIDKMRATLRSAHGIPCVMRCTANPGGPGQTWIYERYVKPAPPMTPFTDEATHTRRVFIPSRVADNKILMTHDPGYIDRLRASGPAWLVRAWLEGDWTVSQHQTYFSEAALLVDGRPVTNIPRPDVIYAVVDTAFKTGADHDASGVVYFAATSFGEPPLTILDWDIVQIDSDLLHGWLQSIRARLLQLEKQLAPRYGAVAPYIEDAASGTTLIQHARREGLGATPLPADLTAMGKDGRAFNAGPYVHAGMVKISEYAFNKTEIYAERTRNHLLHQVTSYITGVRDTHQMDLLDCFTYGVAIGVDTRKLGAQ